jgi:flagellar FliL protein
MSMADDVRLDAGQAQARQPSMTTFMLIVAGLTLAAAAIGFFAGQMILSGLQGSARTDPAQHAGYLGERQRLESAKLRPLPPIVTNLADAANPVWIRLEASLVFDEVPGNVEELSARISEDILSFLRTVSMKQLEGAAGFQYLSEDLNERVRARSDGVVRELIIQGLIVE